MDNKKKRQNSLCAIIIGLPLSIVGAASQSIIVGSIFGFVLTLGIDGLIGSFK